MVDDGVATAERAARAHAHAAGQLAEFLRRIRDAADPAVRVELSTLLAREKSTRDERDDALAAAGLQVPSLGDEDTGT